MADGNLTIRIADLPEFRLFCWELRRLVSDMRIGADPFTDRLEHALDRFVDELEPNGVTAPGLTTSEAATAGEGRATELRHAPVEPLFDGALAVMCQGPLDMGGGRCWRCGQPLERVPLEDPPTAA